MVRTISAARGVSFLLGWWACLLSATAAPVLSEIMASNKTTLADRDGEFSDWVEIYNPDAEAVDLNGWYLTDNAANKTKWQFPAVSIPAGGYLVVFASDKDRRDPTGELHTRFALSADGEYLGLIQPDGATVAAEFAPSYPAQSADVSYGLSGTSEGKAGLGFLVSPTPGAANPGLGLTEQARIAPGSRTFQASLQVTLAGAGPGKVIRYEILPPSSSGLVAAEPTEKSPAYTEPVTITSSVALRAAIFSADGSARGPSSTALFVRLAETGAAPVTTFSSRLPIVLLDDHGIGPLEQAQGEKPAWLQLFTPGDTGVSKLGDSPTVETSINMKVRGSSSAAFPKKSYSVELRDTQGDSAPLPLLGLGRSDDWALVSPWTYDLAYLRNPYAYALSTRLGRWAPATRWVELFFKTGGEALEPGHYAGISVLTERIKIGPNLVPLTELKPTDITAPAVTGGYVLKFDPKDADEYGWITDRGIPRSEGIELGTMLVLASPKAAKLAPEQRDYIRGYVQKFEQALFADRDAAWATRNHLDYIDRPSWVDFHLLQVLTKNSDGLARSAYFTKDREGKLKAGPVWDFDRAMGSTDPRSRRWDEWNEANEGAPFWQIGWWALLARDPEFMQAWVDRWQALRRDAFTDEKLAGLATSLAEHMDPGAPVRDVARWPDNAPEAGSWLGEVDFLSNWVRSRAGWIDRQFVAPPTPQTVGGTRRVVPSAGTQIVYTTDGSDPRAIGGSVAAGAKVQLDALLLEDGIIYTVRMYTPGLANVFPGSPWSGVVNVTSQEGGMVPPGSESAPKLMNLASRGAVGEGQPLICGLSVGPGQPKRYLVRGIGPALDGFGVKGTLPDPVLRIRTSQGQVVAQNADWRTNPNRSDVVTVGLATGAFPLSDTSRDAALVVTLAPGAYTVEISSEEGRAGTALAELYAADVASAAANLSSRAFFPSGDVLIGGITLSGSTPRRLLVRAIGPTLRDFGVTDSLADPNLAVYAGSVLVATNDDWGSAANAEEIASAAASSGAFKLEPGTKDAAVLLSLEPGSYTVQVGGKAADGSGLLEVYELPSAAAR